MATPRRVVHQRIRWIYQRLWRRWGPQGWWPAQHQFEMMVGAILTQHASWRNVERAVARLREAEALSVKPLRRMPRRRLERLVRPVGFFRVKARRLHAFVEWLQEAWDGSVRRLLRQPVEHARSLLLSVPGIGPETADAMLLYAGRRPVFVVDAYTRRICVRHGLVPERASYHEVQQLFHAALPRNTRVYNEYHALLVRLGKTYCRTRPQCDRCPLYPLPRVRGVWPTTHRTRHRRLA